MIKTIVKWLRLNYNRIIHSIAFYPALIAIAFLILSYVVLQLDFTDFGKNLKAQWHFSLKDASTARTIAATIAAGILSLTVFSFSMVMILLNQAASNMSNRVLDQLIGNRFHQIVLGFYIGTIVYALFLLSTIRDIDSGIYVPALSVYILIGLAIIDIFLFIYFIHYITQSVKYDTIIARVHAQTRHALEQSCTLPTPAPTWLPWQGASCELLVKNAGYLQSINHRALARLCQEKDWRIVFLVPFGTFLLPQSPVLTVQNLSQLTDNQQEEILHLLDFHTGQSYENNPYYGFRQLMEIALKALSPGINDPGTAILSLHRLMDLLAFRLQHFPDPVITDEKDTPRIWLYEPDFKSLIQQYLLPIWDYGKDDRQVQQELKRLLRALLPLATLPAQQKIIHELQEKVET